MEHKTNFKYNQKLRKIEFNRVEFPYGHHDRITCELPCITNHCVDSFIDVVKTLTPPVYMNITIDTDQTDQVDESPTERLFQFIYTLTSLETMYLNVKNIDTLNIFDAKISGLINLETLNINGNNDTSGFPKDIINMKNLKSLSLNKFYKLSLPENFGELKNLRSLSLLECKINNLPESLGDIENLESLDIFKSPIKTLPESFKNLKKLSNLTICDTKLESIPKEISEFTELEYLEVLDNPLLNEESVKVIRNVAKNIGTENVNCDMFKIFNRVTFKWNILRDIKTFNSEKFWDKMKQNPKIFNFAIENTIKFINNLKIKEIKTCEFYEFNVNGLTLDFTFSDNDLSIDYVIENLFKIKSFEGKYDRANLLDGFTLYYNDPNKANEWGYLYEIPSIKISISEKGWKAKSLTD
jgi:hypothetical protein